MPGAVTEVVVRDLRLQELPGVPGIAAVHPTWPAAPAPVVDVMASFFGNKAHKGFLLKLTEGIAAGIDRCVLDAPDASTKQLARLADGNSRSIDPDLRQAIVGNDRNRWTSRRAAQALGVRVGLHTSKVLAAEQYRYLLAMAQALHSAKTVAMVVDGTRFSNKDWLHGFAMNVDTQRCAWMPPQVMKEVVFRTDGSEKPTKEEKEAWKATAEQYIAKAFAADSQQDSKTVMIPKKMERAKSYQTLHAEDWQLQAVGIPGYKHFCLPDPDDDDYKGPDDRNIEDRPALILNRDQGPSNVSAMCYLLYHKRARVMPVWDCLHRRWNSTGQAMKDSDIWLSLRLQTVAYEMGRGPWHGGAFHCQEVEAAEEMLQMLEPDDVLFQHYFPAICEERGLDEATAVAADILQEIKAAPWLARLGPRAAETRWWSFFHSFMFWDGHVAERLMVLSFLGLHKGWFWKKEDGEFVLKPLTVKAGAPPDQDEEKKTTSQNKEEVRRLRDKAANGLHFASIIFANKDIQADCIMAFYATTYERKWHEEVSKQLGDPEKCLQLAIALADGSSLLPCIRKTAEIFSDENALHRMGMHVDFAGSRWRKVTSSSPEVWDQNRLAEKLRRLVCDLIAQTMRFQLLWMYLCPHRFLSLLSKNAAVVQECLRAMRRLADGWEKVASMNSPFWRAFKRRSCMNWLLTEETLELAKQGNYEMTDALRAQVLRLAKHPMSTLLNERCFQKLRDHERDNSSRAQSGLSLWSKPISKGVLSRDHSFNEVSGAEVPIPAQTELPKSLFKPIYSQSSDAFKGLAGVGAPKFCSIQASGWPCLGADANFLEWCGTNDSFGVASNSWKSSLACAGMFLSKGATAKVYFVVLSQSCMVYMWPAVEQVCGKSKVWTLSSAADATLHAEPILNLESWWCVPVETLSPLGLYVANNNRRLAAPPSFAAYQTGKRMNLLKWCAKNAFFEMTLAQLKVLDKEEVHATTQQTDIANMLALMIQKVLGCSDEEAGDIMMKRCIPISDERSELMQSEETEAALDREDQKECDQHVQRAVRTATVQKHIMAKVRTLRAKDGPAKAKKPKTDARAIVWPKDNKVSVADAEKMVPPGYYFWTDNVNRRFRVFDPDRVSVSRSWSLHGEGAALRTCVQWAWERYQLSTGNKCTVEGVFGMPLGGGASASEAAAASSAGQ